MRAPGRFRVFRGDEGVAELFGASVVAFGKFDGVHRGHRALLDRALASGRRLGLPVGAVTFERHPHAYLRGGRLPPALTGLGDRLRLLRDAGVEFVVLLPTDATVLGLAAEDFARQVLRVACGSVSSSSVRTSGSAGAVWAMPGRCDVSCRRPASMPWSSRWRRSTARWCRRRGSASTWLTATWAEPATCSAGRTTSSVASPAPPGHVSSGYPRCGRYPRPVATGPRSGRSARGIAGRRRRSSWSIRAANVSTTWRWSCRENGLPAGAAGHGVRVMFEGTGRGPGGASRGG